MELDDRVTIATPEGIELELQLAGLGSRFIAGVTDLIIQVILLAILALVTGGISDHNSLNTVVDVIGAFVILFFYPILFEVLARGRTPGKRLTHLRVVRDTGAPDDLPASAIRNLMRAVDGPLLLYLPTVVFIVATAHNQRPGDLAAGTLVIREGAGQRSSDGRATATDLPPNWDVSAITPQELAAVRQFLERRDGLDRKARSELAARLANGLGAKVAGAQLRGDPEVFLQTLADLKARGR
ncbi:MAG TPA: RDD family protein [Solirubrobacteraceae bacterium]|nr:RDD family protein [Solirubrobacteraceae bacterium]